MPQIIELSDSTYSRLVKMMNSDDTTESIVLSLLGSYKVRTGKDGGASLSSDAPDDGKLHFTGAEPTDLKHAKVLEAKINGLELPKASWNTILSHLAVEAFKKGLVDSSEVISGIVRSKKTDSGYKFYPMAGISFRGQAANIAWRASVKLADKLNADVFVEFEWRNKKGAKHPGEKAVLKNR